MPTQRVLLLILLSFSSLMGYSRLLIVSGQFSGDHLGAWYLDTQCSSTTETWGVGGAAITQRVTHHIDSGNVRTLGAAHMLIQITELWRLWSLRDELVDLAQTQQITHAVLVDFPLMNLLLARRLHNLGIHVTYIAPPEMWLWGTWGLNHWLRWYCDDVIVLYPFEQEWYAEKNLQTSWHGWPRYQEFTHYNIPKTKECTLALLPGSRRNELERMVPCFYEVAEQLAHLFPDLQFHWMVPHMLHEHPCFDAIKNGALRECMTLSEVDHDRLASCCAALSKPGTITLELALLHVPTIIAFDVSWLTYTLASWCAQLPWVGLPNILLNKEVMPELLQEKCTPAAIVPALRTLITQWQQNTDSYHATLDDCATLHRLMHQAHSV